MVLYIWACERNSFLIPMKSGFLRTNIGGHISGLYATFYRTIVFIFLVYLVRYLLYLSIYRIEEIFVTILKISWVGALSPNFIDR